MCTTASYKFSLFFKMRKNAFWNDVLWLSFIGILARGKPLVNTEIVAQHFETRELLTVMTQNKHNDFTDFSQVHVTKRQSCSTHWQNGKWIKMLDGKPRWKSSRLTSRRIIYKQPCNICSFYNLYVNTYKLLKKTERCRFYIFMLICMKGIQGETNKTK
jgi:hypothetical protein